MSIDLTIEPASPAQVYFLNSTKRNILFNSGYGAGKTYVACYKLLLLLLKFPKSRAVVGRLKYTDLMKTTAQTFYQLCKSELYAQEFGGSRADGRGYLRLINGSEVYFMHFDDIDLGSIKSLEINFLLLDQAEEISEAIYLALDARLGRKADAEVPEDLLELYPDWPLNEHTKKPLVPVYSFILINPPDEGELHYLIQRFHPSSDEWKMKWVNQNDYVWSSSRDNKALPKENLDNMLTRDPEWVARYVDGQIGQGEGTIHRVSEESLIELDTPERMKFLENLIRKASLCRVLDHGASAPTCCLWFASYKGFHYCYREYYVADKVISIHRKNINDLSRNEYYSRNLADPSIFKKQQEKYGGFWTVALEYMDSAEEFNDSPTIVWTPADNNEFATRNRINELLQIDPNAINPITGKLGSPRLFFFKQKDEFGCFHAIRQLKAQKKLLLDTINGKNVYSDDRDEKIADHSYDCIRYYCASHLSSNPEPQRKPSERSFFGLVKRIKALKQENYYDQYEMQD